MDYRYTYLLMGLVYALIWLILFFWRKDTRKEMLIFSLMFSAAGPIADVLYIQDWWHPPNLTNTGIGFEAFLVGFMIGGIIAVIYKCVFRKKSEIKKVTKKEELRKDFKFVLFFIPPAILFFGSFYLLNFSSFHATILSFVVPAIIIWIKRKDLVVQSLLTGILLVLVASFVYFVLDLLTPGWVNAFWYFKNVPSVIFLNLPLDDIVWYFVAGLFIGPLYDFWQKSKLVDL